MYFLSTPMCSCEKAFMNELKLGPVAYVDQSHFSRGGAGILVEFLPFSTSSIIEMKEKNHCMIFFT